MKRLLQYCALTLLLSITAPVSLAQLPEKPTQKPLNQPGEDTNFQRFLTSGRTSIVVFYADWCPTCRQWTPLLHAVNRSFPDLQVLFLDIREWDSPITEKYDIQSIPYFRIYDTSGSLMVEGQEAKDWLRQAIQQRLQASANGTYRLSSAPTVRVTVGESGRSASTRPNSSSKAGRTSSNIRSEKIDSAGPLPSLDQVIERYLKAIGGENAAKFHTRIASGKLNIPTVGRGSFTTMQKAPNKLVVTVEFPGGGKVAQGFNGTAGWSKNARTGVRSVGGSELATMKREADVFAPLQFKSNYPVMKLLGVSKIGFREAYVVEARPSLGEAERLYFSKENGLLIKLDAVKASPRGRMMAEVYLDDWKDVDGIKMPFTITQLFPGLSLVFTVEEVKHDAPIDDVVFNRPVSR